VHSWPDVRRGGERYLHELAAGLRRAGHDVSILSTGQQPGRSDVLGVPVHRLPVRRFPGAGDLGVEVAFGAQSLGRLGLAALTRRFDVWHATSTSDAAAAALSGRRIRSVFTDHGFPAAASRAKRSDRRLHAFVARHVDSYVCVSSAAAAFLWEDFGRRAEVIPPGVRWDGHAPGVRERRPTLLYAGSLVESRKGVGLLLEAAAELRRQVPALQVWLLGQGTAPTSVDTALVTRCGPLDDAALRDAYASAWVTVLPSTAESFGMTLVESLASGTPVVARRDGGGPAEIVDAPEVGRLAEPTAEGLAVACGEALELAALPGTATACRDHARRYDWDEAVVPALLEVYAG
jgi:glycosyltransferase involved in cell wall biosynthesis